MSESVHTERYRPSPDDKANRIRRCVTAIQQGASVKLLKTSKRFSWDEIAKAREMLAEGKRK